MFQTFIILPICIVLGYFNSISAQTRLPIRVMRRMALGLGILLIATPVAALAQPSEAIPGNYTCGTLNDILQAGMPWQRNQLLLDIEHEVNNMRDLETALNIPHGTQAQRSKAEIQTLSVLPIACTNGFGPGAPLSLLAAESYLGSLASEQGIKFPPKNLGDVMVPWMNQVPTQGN